jgi:chromosome segregation ATPase
LNESSDTTDNASHEVGRSSWKWIGLIGALAFLVVCLNTSLFLLVQRHEREIAEREVDAQRRLVLVEAKEAQRSALTADISSLEARRAAALRRTEEAEKASADATQMQSLRDSAVQELRAAETERGKKNAEAEVLEARLAALKSEESSVEKMKSARSEEVASFEKRRDVLFTDIKGLEDQKLTASREAENALKSASDASKQKAERDSISKDRQEKAMELASLQVLIEGLKASRNSIAVDEGAAKRADAARAEAEKSLAKTQDELRSVQQQLSQAKSEAVRLEQVRAAALTDDNAAKRANSERAEAEKTLKGVLDELSAARDKLAATRAELAQSEQRRSAVAVDESAAKAAQAARIETEKALSKVRGDLLVLQQQVAETQNDLVRLERLRDSIAVDDAAARKAEAARGDAEKRLTEARNQLDDVRREIIQETQRLNSLHVEIDNNKSASTEPGSTFQSVPPRRPEIAAPNIAPRTPPIVPRPSQRVAPNTPPRPSPVPN